MLALGVDIGSVSSKIAAVNQDKEILASVYLETEGTPISAIQELLRRLKGQLPEDDICGIGITGSGRHIAAHLLGADLVKNEVTAQTIAALHYDPEVRSIIEIGGQDSKVILLKNGIPVWHNLNSICAAGTGSFLSAQAYRLKIPIEQFGELALRSTVKVSISAKCTVFCESDCIHKQAFGYKKEDIINGLCEGLARNFINNVARNKNMEAATLFSGGVAANIGVVRAFERELKHPIIVPDQHKIMGCIGVALLVLRQSTGHNGEEKKSTKFKGFEILNHKFKTEPFVCGKCSNNCEVIKILEDSKVIGYMNSRCGRWQ